MPSIKFIKEKLTVEVVSGANLRQEALKAGADLYPGIHKLLNCRGLGCCASCHVIVKKGETNCSRMGIKERLRFVLAPVLSLLRIGHEDTLRLACQTKVTGDIEIETQPELNWFGERFWG